MNKCRNFTLIELLVVIGIIVLLAGLLLPTILGGQQKARITQAKADMSSIMMVLKEVESTYNRMVKESSTKDEFNFNGKKVKATSNGSGTDDGMTLILGEPGKTDSIDAYYAFIAELSDPNNSGLTSLNINLRKRKFLDPKTKYNATEKYDTADNLKQSWIDPWGNPYVLLLNTDFSDKIKVPSGKIISGKVAMYSLGPNGSDEKGQNTLYDTDISGSEKVKKIADDVTSWN